MHAPRRPLTEAEFNEIVSNYWKDGTSTTQAAGLFRRYHHTDVSPDVVRRAYVKLSRGEEL